MKPLRYNLPMLDDLRLIFEKNCQLTRSQPIIVGVSGGADSLSLLSIFVRWGYPVRAAHFNHLLRPEASGEAQIVEEIAETLRIPFALGVGRAADYARDQNLSIEEAARELRYRFLFQEAENHAAQVVAVAHNADDQVETVLMHLLRGAGLDGLTGMPYLSLPNPWSDSIPLARPLLGIWRAEINTYCSEQNLMPMMDATNNDPAFFRNRLRHKLIPELETYVPGFRSRLWQTADLLSTDRRMLDELNETAWTEVVEQTDIGFTTFRLPAFRLQPLALKRRLVRQAVSLLRPGARDLDFSMVRHVINFTEQPTSTGQSDIGLGLRVFLEGDQLFIAAWEADLPTFHWPQITTPLSFLVPGELDLGSRWMLKAEIPLDLESAKFESQKNSDPFNVWMDLGERPPLLSIRGRLPGERFQPLGMNGQSLKISDFMINQKIPRRARADWPLICTGAEIAWVPGYRLGHAFRITDQTQIIVKLTLQPG